MPPDSEEPAPAESQVMEPEPAPPPAEAVADSAEAETDTAETEPADAPEQQAAVSSDPSTPRAVPEPDQVPETEAGAEPVVTIADRTDADEITEVPERPVFPSELTPDEATEVPLETEPIEESESRRLTRRVERWATRFAALAEWQPETTWTARGQEYSATVSRIPATDSMGVEEAIVTITTERDGEQFATRMRMKRLGFSHFVQFVDRWDPKVFIHDDVIDGRFHSNSEINISREGGAQPTFTGKVTTRGIDSSGSPQAVRRSEVFLGGLDIRAARINLPRRLSLFADEDIAPERLHRFNVDTHIIFHSDGSYSWTEIRSRRDADAASTIADAGDRHRMLTDEPHYIVAADDVELHISGTLDGKVLIYSPKRIVVEGDLVYAEHPASFPDSDDYLGLVSERDVAIAEPEVTGPGDLHLHAAIYARNRFAVRNFRHSADGTLFVYGSITAGSLTATEPRFSTQINFDKRLEQMRPPRFPVTDRYEISEWGGQWTAIPASTVP
jgi:hypothetical protein